MKIKRFFAFLLIFALPIFSASSPPPNVGTDILSVDRQMHYGLTYSENTIDHSSAGRQEERVFVRDYNSPAVPVLVGSDNLFSAGMTISQAADKLKSWGYTIIGGINGDLFTLSTGVPIGMTVYGGVLKTCDNDLSALGILPDGKAFIGTPGLSAYVSAGGSVINIDRINRIRDPNAITLYTSDFASDTKTTKNGRHVALYVSGKLKLGQPITGTVKEIVDGTAPYNLREGEMVLSASTQAQIDMLGTLIPGTSITLSVQTQDTRFHEALYVCGGLNRLVRNGTTLQGFAAGRAPRTSVGVKEDGSIILYTVDGRQSGYSQGLNLDELASRMASLGAYNAIELDGGGSTSMLAVLPGSDIASITNKPSDGSLRKCSNYIFLVNTAQYIGTPVFGYVSAERKPILAGAEVQMSFSAGDQNYFPVAAPIPHWLVSDGGNISQNGLFSAPAEGVYTIMAQGNGIYGEWRAVVKDKPDSIKILLDSKETAYINGEPGTSVNLSAVATVSGLEMISQNGCYTWTVLGENAGYFESPGRLIFGNAHGAEGIIRVSAGGIYKDIPFTVGSLYKEPIKEPFRTEDNTKKPLRQLN